MERSFAGFWVDGAVRKPNEHCFDGDGLIHIKWKHDFPDFDIATTKFSPWNEVYWLDTTPRESLTPEELFSVVRVIWPKCEKVLNPGSYATVKWQVQLDEKYEHTPIDWGNLTQYPPPHVEPKWIRVTRENVGQYLFRDCRTQKNDITYAGRIVGWCIEDDCCLVESDYQTEEPILQWDSVEVCIDPTS